MFPLEIKRNFGSSNRLILVRHGETEGNARGLMMGHTDMPLNHNGRHHALSVAKSISDLVSDPIIYTSDLKRAAETAEAIGRCLHVSPNDRVELREANHGVLDGKDIDDPAFAELKSTRKVDMRGFRPPGGESYRDVAERLDKFLTAEATYWGSRDVVLVSHLGVIRALCMLIASPSEEQFAFRMPHESYCLIDFTKGESQWGVPL